MLFLLSLFTALKYSKNKILNEQCHYAAEFFSSLQQQKNTIKAGGSTARAQNVEWVSG